jgi:hypothetical protein
MYSHENFAFCLKSRLTQRRLVNWLSAREMAALPNAPCRTALLLLARIRKPSCITSCSKPGPAEGLGRVGWQGWMKPIGGARRERAGEVRHNMRGM